MRPNYFFVYGDSLGIRRCLSCPQKGRGKSGFLVRGFLKNEIAIQSGIFSARSCY